MVSSALDLLSFCYMTWQISFLRWVQLAVTSQIRIDCISRWKVGFITNYYSGHFAGRSKTVPSRVMEIEPNGGSMPTWDSYGWVYNPGDPGLS